MKKAQYCTGTNTFKSVVLPIFLIVCVVASAVSFYCFFVKDPQQKTKEINQLIAEKEYGKAADLLYDFSYGDFYDRETLKEICANIPELRLFALDVGDTVEFGQYEQNGDLSSREHIKWTVAERNGRILRLEAVNIIEYMPIVDEETIWDKNSKWKDSSLWKWLNGPFYEESFSEIEKRHVVKENEGITIIGGPHYGDSYLSEATVYVKRKGIRVYNDGTSPVWTCNEWDYSNPFDAIGKSKTYEMWTKDSNEEWARREKPGVSELGGIRPVMWITVSSLTDQNSLEGDNQ